MSRLTDPSFLVQPPVASVVTPEWERPAYLKWVATLPCLITGSPMVQVHHLLRGPERMAHGRRDDREVLPLYWMLHHSLHDEWGDEVAFFAHFGIHHPYTTAAMLWTLWEGPASVDNLDAAARRVLMEARE